MTPRTADSFLPPSHPLPHSPQTYAVSTGALQLQVAVELCGQSTLALHLPAEMKGAAPGAILPAVNHIASTALGKRQGDNKDGHKNNNKDSRRRVRGEKRAELSWEQSSGAGRAPGGTGSSGGQGRTSLLNNK